jgi:hypothetical protein
MNNIKTQYMANPTTATPATAASGTIACFDGAVVRNGAANQTESTNILAMQHSHSHTPGYY